MDQATCPLCRGTSCENLGRVLHPTPTHVGGQPIDLEGAEFRLLRCDRCRFAFKDPPIPEEKLLACYDACDAGYWGQAVDGVERRYDVIAAALQRHAAGRRILDIGCFTGTLLQSLGDEWEKYGLEPAQAASQLAQQRGIQILGRTLEDLTDRDRFDAIVAIDVIEHLPRPMDFFHRVAQHLAPKGIFVALTGNTAAWTWRLYGSRHWYCGTVEHVSFYDPASVRYAADASAMTLREVSPIAHHRLPLGGRLLEAFKTAVYLTARGLAPLGAGRVLPGIVNRHSPTCVSVRDHLLAVCRKN